MVNENAFLLFLSYGYPIGLLWLSYGRVLWLSRKWALLHLLALEGADVSSTEDYLLLFLLLHSLHNIWQLEAIVRPPSTQGVI